MSSNVLDSRELCYAIHSTTKEILCNATYTKEGCDTTTDWSYEEDLHYTSRTEEWEQYDTVLSIECNFRTPSGERLHHIVMEELIDGIREEPYIDTLDIREIYRTMWASTYTNTSYKKCS